MPDPIVMLHPAAARAAPHRAELPPRLQTVMAEAQAASRADGERIGYMHGWRVGLITGAVLGSLFTTLGWMLYLSLATPRAAPPVAERPAVQLVQR